MRELSINDIEEIIRKDESRYLELKESTGELDKGLASGCAFLNTDGGWLMFGITNKLKIVGHQVTDSTKREIAQHLRMFEPAIDIAVQYIELPDKPGFFVIAVYFCPDEQSRAPYLYSGRAYYKVESTTMVMPMEMLEARLRQRNPQRLSWEAIPCRHMSVDDLDSVLLERVVRDGIDKGRIPPSALKKLDAISILNHFKLVENGKLLNAAIVLFGKKPRNMYIQCCLRLARFEGTDMTAFRDQTVCEGNLFEQYDTAVEFCQKHMFLSSKMDEQYRNDTLTVPYKALREAIINLLCHRDWEQDNLTPSIAIFNDRMRLTNPGHFPIGHTWEELMRDENSIPRNPTIANVFYKRGAMEGWGRGIHLIMEECKKAGMPEPRFESNGSFVSLTIKFKEHLTPHGTDSGTNSGTDSGTDSGTEKMPDNKARMVYEIIKATPSVTKQELSASVGVSIRTVQRMLNNLKSQGFIERTGTKSGYWVVLK